MSTTILYLGFSVSLVLVILLIHKYISRRIDIKNKGRQQVIVDAGSEHGMIRIDARIVLKELVMIRDLIKQKAPVVGPSCTDMTKQIKHAMKSITQFIKLNPPEQTNAICNLDLSAGVVNQQMSLSVNPEDRDVNAAYKTILEQEKTERDMPDDPEELMRYLLVNIDVVIKLLRFDLCQNGILNLKKLYEILQKMNQRMCAMGKSHDTTAQGLYTKDFPVYSMWLSKYQKYDNPPNLPLFTQEGPILEPFQGRENPQRHHRLVGNRDNFATLSKYDSDPYAAMSDTNVVNDSTTIDYSKVANEQVLASSIGSTPTFSSADPQDLYAAYNHQDNLPVSLSIPGIKRPTGPLSTLQDTPYSVYDKYNTQDVPRTICDGTFEGSVGCDILGYKPPGHIISQLYDKSDHYTVNTNSCAQNSTTPRSTSTCYLEDIAMRNALDGSPEQMLNCVGDCYNEPNYFRWNHKLNTATKDMEFILNPDE